MQPSRETIGMGKTPKLPLEQAIAATTDRRAKYESAQRAAGFVKTSMWIRSEAVPEVKFLVKCLNATNGKMLADLQALTESWEQCK
jgi:hypothetical protein